MYVKVFGTMLDSSIWQEPPVVCKVWITMLCMANRDGMVKAVERAIAQRAVMSLEDCREALAVLEQPDVDSRTQDYGGRRIERVEGGWLVLNYTKYRELRTDEQVREADKKKRQRSAKSTADKQLAQSDVVPTADVPGRVPDVPPYATAPASASQEVLTAASASVEKSGPGFAAILGGTEGCPWCDRAFGHEPVPECRPRRIAPAERQD